MSERYLTVYVYRCGYFIDASNNGISSVADVLYLQHEEGDTDRETVRRCAPLARVKLRTKNHDGREYTFAVPESLEDGVLAQFGGTFIHSTDSRFPSRYPIPLHDRFE